MKPLPHAILRCARLFLDLSQNDVEKLCGVSRATIARLETGRRVDAVYYYTLQTFYISQGITFISPSDGEGWGLLNRNTRDDPSRLNRLGGEDT